METWLSLDLSTATGTLALHRYRPDTTPVLLREEVVGDSFQHSEKLMGVLIRVLEEERISLPGVSRFLTSQGPGSFTGLRIAFATLKAFSMVHGQPIDTMSGAEARAWAWRAQKGAGAEGRIPVYTHVAHNSYVESVFVEDGKGLRLERESLVPSLADVGVMPDFSVRARYLGDAMPLACTRQTHSTPAEWIALSPKYLGSTRF